MMKKSLPTALTIFGALLIVTLLAVAQVRADPNRELSIQPENRERGMELRFSITEPDERFLVVKSEGKNAGWAFGLSRPRPIGLHGYRDEPVGAPVPEPATMLLMGMGLAGLGNVIRKRRTVTK